MDNEANNNSIDNVATTPFQYPVDEIQTVVKDENITKLLDFICCYLLTDSNPRLTLLALCYSAGYNVGEIFNTNNTIRSIAKVNGLTHMSLYKRVKQIENELQLKPLTSNGHTRKTS